MSWRQSTRYHGKKTKEKMARVLNKKEEAVATFTLRGVDKMSNYQRMRLSNWLREQADFIQRQGPEIAPRYRARYLKP